MAPLARLLLPAAMLAGCHLIFGHSSGEDGRLDRGRTDSRRDQATDTGRDAQREDAVPDGSFVDAPRPDAWLADAPGPDAQVADVAKPDAPKPDAWKPDAPKPDTKHTEARLEAKVPEGAVAKPEGPGTVSFDSQSLPQKAISVASLLWQHSVGCAGGVVIVGIAHGSGQVKKVTYDLGLMKKETGISASTVGAELWSAVGVPAGPQTIVVEFQGATSGVAGSVSFCGAGATNLATSAVSSAAANVTVFSSATAGVVVDVAASSSASFGFTPQEHVMLWQTSASGIGGGMGRRTIVSVGTQLGWSAPLLASWAYAYLAVSPN